MVWDNLNTHVSAQMKVSITARSWSTVFRLPAYAPEFNPVEAARAHMKKTPANLAVHTVDQLARPVKNRLKRMRCRPAPIAGFTAKTSLYFHSS